MPKKCRPQVMIFMAHLPLKTFFGYNFSTKKWAVPTRVAHDWLGYAILLMTLAQSAMGLYKLMSAREGRSVKSAMVENHKKTIGKWWFNGGLMGFNQQNGDFNGMYPLVMSK